jgi:hypothetical protein
LLFKFFLNHFFYFIFIHIAKIFYKKIVNINFQFKKKVRDRRNRLSPESLEDTMLIYENVNIQNDDDEDGEDESLNDD